MKYIKLFWKTGCRLILILTLASAALCSAAEFLFSLSCGAAFEMLLCSDDFWRIFIAALTLWLAGQGLLSFFSARFAQSVVFSLRKRVLEWFLKENGDGETAKKLCTFGIWNQVWFFMHRYLSVWRSVLALILCLLFLSFTEPVYALLLLFWGVAFLGLCSLLSRFASKNQRAYGKAYMDEMGQQYELLQDADGVRSRGEERFVVSRLISLWRKFRKEEVRLYNVFSFTRLSNIGLIALGSGLFCLLFGGGIISARSFGVTLYSCLILLPSLRRVFHTGPWIDRNKQICADLLAIAGEEAAE